MLQHFNELEFVPFFKKQESIHGGNVCLINKVLLCQALPRLTDRQKVEEMVDPNLRGQYTLKDLIQVMNVCI